MYSFAPIPDVPVDHVGFYIIVVFVVFCFMVSLTDYDLRENSLFHFILGATTVGIAYGVSYHWTDQTTKTFTNEKVIAEFVGYQPEGYRESSGKSKVDRHYVYVIYSVNGNHVLLQAKSGMEFPKTAVLYKN